MTKPIDRTVPASPRVEATELYTPLPEDIPQAVWGQWPRKLEAHYAFGVTARLVAARIKVGQLKCYACPDDSVRIPVEQLEACFSDRGKLPKSDVSGRRPERSAREQSKLLDSELEIDDPVLGMFRECRIMLRDEREHARLMLQSEREHGRALLSEALAQQAAQLKLLVDPVDSATKLLQETAKRFGDRVEALEQRQDAVMAEREAMADFRHMRDVEIEQIRAREARRSDIVKLLQKELGPVLISKIAGGTLADFVAGVSPELVDMLIASGMLSARHTEQLSALVAEQRARAAGSQSNGAAAPQPAS